MANSGEVPNHGGLGRRIGYPQATEVRICPTVPASSAVEAAGLVYLAVSGIVRPHQVSLPAFAADLVLACGFGPTGVDLRASSLANGGFGQHHRHDSEGIRPEIGVSGCKLYCPADGLGYCLRSRYAGGGL